MMVRRCRNRLMVRMFTATVFTAAVLLAGCIQESSPPAGQTGKSQPPGIPTDKAQPEVDLLTEGATLFAKLCTSCHGTGGNGRGNQRGPSLQRAELTYGRTAATITQSIRDGRPGGMPSFGHVFTPRQLEALSVYVLSLKK